MSLYTHRAGNKVYVAEGDSREEAIIKFFNMMTSLPESRKTIIYGGIEITECPDRLVSTPETREVMYDR